MAPRVTRFTFAAPLRVFAAGREDGAFLLLLPFFGIAQ
jgi:hypothetical protein